MHIEKKYKVFLICLILLCFVPGMCANAMGNDNVGTPIEIKNCKVNKKNFKKGDKMKYSFTIKDIRINDYIGETEQYGRFNWIDEIGGDYGEPPYYLESDAVYLYWKSSGKQYIVHAFEWNKQDKENGELKISGSIPVKKGMQKGNWRLAAIYFSYDEEVFCVKDNREIKGQDDSPAVDFSVMDFKVSGTGKVDKKAPTLDLNSMRLSKTYVKKKQKSTFSIKVKDSSKIEEVVCIWDIYDKANKSKVSDYSEIYRMKYNKKTKTYQCAVRLDVKYEQKAQLVGIEVQDIYGNEKKYYAYEQTYSADYDEKIPKYYKAYKNMTVRAKK